MLSQTCRDSPFQQAKPEPAASRIRIKKQRRKLTIRTDTEPATARAKMDSDSQPIVNMPANVIQIEGVDTTKGTPNIQINYHTYITNYSGCYPMQYGGRPYVIVGNNRKEMLEPQTVRNSMPEMKPRPSFVEKLHDQVQQPRAVHHPFKQPKSKIPDEEEADEMPKDLAMTARGSRFKIKLGNSERHMTVLNEGVAMLSPEFRAKLAQSIKHSFALAPGQNGPAK